MASISTNIGSTSVVNGLLRSVIRSGPNGWHAEAGRLLPPSRAPIVPPTRCPDQIDDPSVIWTIDDSILEGRDTRYIDSASDGFSRMLTMLPHRVSGYVGTGGAETLAAYQELAGWAQCLLLADVDAFASVGEAVDGLLSFRRAHPRTPVLIGSRRFSTNDLGRLRLPIAGASVRLPVSRVNFALALAAAVANTAKAVEHV